MDTSTLLYIVAAYIAGSIFVGVPLTAASLTVWRKGVEFRRKKGQSANYTGSFWSFVLFPKAAITESVGRFASEPRGIRFIGLGTRRRYRTYLALTMILWLPRLIFNVLSLVWWTSYIAILAIVETDRSP